MYFGVCLSQIGEDRITGAREEEWEAKLRVWDNAHHLVRCSREEEWELRSEEREGRKLRAYTGIDLVERDLRAGDSTLWFDRAQLRVWDNAHHLARCTRDEEWELGSEEREGGNSRIGGPSRGWARSNHNLEEPARRSGSTF